MNLDKSNILLLGKELNACSYRVDQDQTAQNVLSDLESVLSSPLPDTSVLV